MMKLQTQSLLTAASACAALAAGSANAALVGSYQFEETSGTTLVDSSGNTNNGTLQGAGDLDVAGAVGASGYQPGGANGNYGEIDNGVATFGIGGNNARTIAFWFNTSNFGIGVNDQHRLIGMGDGAASSFDITAENPSGNQIGLRYGNGNVFFDADNSGTKFATDTWYHVAVVYDGTNLDLNDGGTSDGTGLIFYVNGVEVNVAGGNSNNATQALSTSATDIALGAKFDGSLSSGASNGYPGLLDDVRFYNEALSASAVAALVPEPGSLALLGLGGLLVASRRRRG
jgi:hypothetical protein